MIRCTLRRTAQIAALAACLLYAAAPTALALQEEWGPVLTDQMLAEYDCDVAFFSQVAEREVNGDVIVIAKVHCADKRTFDAYRPGSFEVFEIHPCENPENRVC